MCVAAAIAGAAVVGGAVSAYGANKAAGAQEDAAGRAAQTQADMYNRTRGDLSSYRQYGSAASQQLASLYGLPGGKGMNGAQISKLLTSLPGYQFQMGQGVQALDRSAASRGMLNSGAQGKALTQYGQGLGSSYFGQYVSGLESMSNQGENAAAMTGQAGAGAANQISGAQIYAGNAAASGYAGMANGINQGINNGIGLYGLYQGGYFGNRNTGPGYAYG